MPTRHEVDRIIVGNQLALMRALQSLVVKHSSQDAAMEIRVSDIKDWWRREFKEEVGFASELGDKPK